jgi:hypothetical protein
LAASPRLMANTEKITGKTMRPMIPQTRDAVALPLDLVPSEPWGVRCAGCCPRGGDG